MPDNRLLVSDDTAGVVNNVTCPFYPSNVLIGADLVVNHIPSLDGIGVIQQSSNDSRAFVLEFDSMLKSDSESELPDSLTSVKVAEIFKSRLYTKRGIDIYIQPNGTPNGGYCLPDNPTSGDEIQFRVIDVQEWKNFIPNSAEEVTYKIIVRLIKV
jgi:hypothetical protein